jgi:hypothetical protein
MLHPEEDHHLQAIINPLHLPKFPQLKLPQTLIKLPHLQISKAPTLRSPRQQTPQHGLKGNTINLFALGCDLNLFENGLVKLGGD